ncbi:MAG: hypothetical protein ACTJIB_15485 [Pseudoalteromonas prydzensis]|uniref:Glyoxalase n=1 Tax=Pseudoalteromonas prydzensis TaxID=182141 RepID=A0ABR9FQP4_9GAMM|nr:hypothetical protein [Pseudoalteromonas prydzensis]MBE0459141.1 hypothetical protein [Pseudoalteromonas prydzensis]
MANLICEELKAYVPAKDYPLSIAFYQQMGFELAWHMIDFVVYDPSGVLWRIGQNSEPM